MHDLFDIVGLSRSAPPVEVRRVCARAVRRAHPDFHFEGARNHPTAPASSLTRVEIRRDVAVDFIEMSAVLDRVQTAFFVEPSSR